MEAPRTDAPPDEPSPAPVPPALAAAAPVAPLPAALAYDVPLAPGQVRPHRPAADSLVVDVGPLPAGRLLLSLAPLAVIFGFLCVELAVLVWSAVRHPGTVPIDKLLLLPSALVWAFVGMELALQFRGASTPVRLTVAGGTFAFPYPGPRSPPEPLRAADVVRLGVATGRSRLLRRRRVALEVALRQGATFALLPGYPRDTLEAICDLLGPALGLDATPDPVDARPGSR